MELTGQWLGHFTYGPEYGEELNGEKVEFRLFIDLHEDDKFTGRSVDLGGLGANYEVAQVKGFVENDFISFTKEYPNYYTIDEAGNSFEDKNKQHPLVAYSGEYNPSTKQYSGQWEMRMDIEPVGEYWLEDVCAGTWELRKDD